jgi:hypothetical protein
VCADLRQGLIPYLMDDAATPGGNNGLLRRILFALDSLNREVGTEATAPTKQHALLRRRPAQS